jgi:hypothetical protein
MSGLCNKRMIPCFVQLKQLPLIERARMCIAGRPTRLLPGGVLCGPSCGHHSSLVLIPSGQEVLAFSYGLAQSGFSCSTDLSGQKHWSEVMRLRLAAADVGPLRRQTGARREVLPVRDRLQPVGDSNASCA